MTTTRPTPRDIPQEILDEMDDLIAKVRATRISIERATGQPPLELVEPIIFDDEAEA